MPVPTLITDLDTVAANNSPPGTESAKGNIDNYLRTFAAFIKQNYNAITGGQIAFPATQNPSSNANTLDDYEEGTWTPVITASAGTFTSVAGSGTYTKIGRAVHITVSINITTLGTAAGGLIFTSPFTAANVGNGGGRDTTTGNQLQAILSGTSCSVFTYSNGFPGGNGSSLQISVTFFTA